MRFVLIYIKYLNRQAVDPEDPPDDSSSGGSSMTAGEGNSGASGQSREEANAVFKEAESARAWEEIQGDDGPRTAKGHNPVVDPMAGKTSQDGSSGAPSGADAPEGGAGGVSEASQEMGVKSPGGGLLPSANEGAAAKVPQVIVPKGMQVIDPPRE